MSLWVGPMLCNRILNTGNKGRAACTHDDIRRLNDSPGCAIGGACRVTSSPNIELLSDRLWPMHVLVANFSILAGSYTWNTLHILHQEIK
jgi:hypothetical protein